MASDLRLALRVFLHETHPYFLSDLLRRVAPSAGVFFSLAALGRDLPNFLSDNLGYYKINLDNLCLRLRGYRNHVLRLAVSHQRGHALRVNAIHVAVGVEN